MIFISMVFSLEGYKKVLNYSIPRKFKFVKEIEVVGKPYVKYGTLYASFIIHTSKGVYDKMKPECKKENKPGFRTSFWGFVICLGRQYDVLGVEKETQEIFNSLNDRETISRVIKTEFVVN